MGRVIASTIAFCLIVIIIIPAILVRGCRPVELPQSALGPPVRVFISDDNRMVEMPLELYLVGVVAAEMPASFPLEALKAQAVAARTFAVKRMKIYGGTGCQEHPGADVCTDYRHCQAWLSEAGMGRKWGYLEGLIWSRKIAHAVMSTAGLIVTYNGIPIDAAFHSSCGGYTENSEDVWSTPVPYLRSKRCEFCSTRSPFNEVKQFSISDIEKRLGVDLRVSSTKTHNIAGRAIRVTTSEMMQRPITVLASSPTGRVKTISIGGKILSAMEMRQALGLRSSKISWQISGQNIRISSTGYGHGVGLCQYGASGMAAQGKSFEEILRYYYTGVDIKSIYP